MDALEEALRKLIRQKGRQCAWERGMLMVRCLLSWRRYKGEGRAGPRRWATLTRCISAWTKATWNQGDHTRSRCALWGTFHQHLWRQVERVLLADGKIKLTLERVEQEVDCGGRYRSGEV